MDVSLIKVQHLPKNLSFLQVIKRGSQYSNPKSATVKKTVFCERHAILDVQINESPKKKIERAIPFL